MINCYLNFVSDKKPFLTSKEKNLYHYWLNYASIQKGLKTVDGKGISVLSAGERNEFEGPDFVNALIMLDGKILKGDVEIHLDNRDWFYHKHHEDKLYNNVVLHVAINGDKGLKTKNTNNRIVPTLFLKIYSDYVPNKVNLCESWDKVSEEDVKRILANYAQIRFQRKCRIIKSGLMQTNPEQYFYKSFLEVLGYSGNREAFKDLAEKVPIEAVYGLLKEVNKTERVISLESLYFGISGFLNDSSRQNIATDSNYFSGLKSRWEKLRSRYQLEENLGAKWHFKGVRPVNHPTRRIAALAQVVSKMFPDLPAQSLVNQIIFSRDVSEVIEWGRENFQQPYGMWRNHPLFEFHPSKVLIGNARLMDLFINLLLPFSWVIGSVNGDISLIKKSERYYYEVGKGEIPAKIKKLFLRLSLPLSLLNRNFLIQGALEFMARFCDLDLCELCPLEEYADR